MTFMYFRKSSSRVIFTISVWNLLRIRVVFGGSEFAKARTPNRFKRPATEAFSHPLVGGSRNLSLALPGNSKYKSKACQDPSSWVSNSFTTSVYRSTGSTGAYKSTCLLVYRFDRVYRVYLVRPIRPADPRLGRQVGFVDHVDR